MTRLLPLGLECKDLRSPAKLNMFIFPSLHVLKSERRLLPRRTPIRQTSSTQQLGSIDGLKGTAAHRGRLGVEKRAEMDGDDDKVREVLQSQKCIRQRRVWCRHYSIGRRREVKLVRKLEGRTPKAADPARKPRAPEAEEAQTRLW